MDKIKNIMVWILMILGIIVLGLMAWGSIQRITKGPSAEAQQDAALRKAQLNYYTLNTAATAQSLSSELPATNSTAQFSPI